MKRAEKGSYKFICFTDAGERLMDKMLNAEIWSGDICHEKMAAVESLSAWVKENFRTGNILVFIGACGIAVRAIAPYVADKTVDPAVIVIDEKGEYVIPVLSGHIGGGVSAAKTIAAIIGATPVITTATDVRGEFAVDVFAAENDLVISDMKKAKEFTADLLRAHEAFYHVDPEFSDVLDVRISSENIREKSISEMNNGGGYSSFTISPGVGSGDELRLIPKCIVLGVGCRKDKAGDELISFAKDVLAELGIERSAVTAVTSIDVKKEEKGILEMASHFGAEFVTFSEDVLMAQEGEFSSSEFVRSMVGADNVCERSVMAYGCARILSGKRAENGMTLAVGVMGRSYFYEG
jgi:cobalt-precorrin 5A hydrolase